ncbi:MFS transporter [Mesorhizobium escarrei]|uniref:Sugar phosphate permease n=1 Tax=Mesorhizobium escarrei TaxID=666018 RepID=A0ABM9E4T5_9HYPH|nr:MFS transporter [Mesorhizobium escarrei]CAH2404128.1 Sugar phosphate permease [Mesorhizobium escarrei]
MITLPPKVAAAAAPDIDRPKGYEWKAVTLMSLGLGLVGIDRFIIVPLMPVLQRDLNLDYQDLGIITGALAIAWGLSSLFTGNLSDRFGFKRVLVPALLAFSVIAGLSGLATGVGTLIIVRAAMGLAEGAFTPASIIATMDASPPKRHGLNVGIQQTMPALLGLGLAPIAVTQLLKVMDWPWIFLLVALPGVIIALLAHKVLRQPTAEESAVHSVTHDAGDHRWYEVFKYRNVPLAVLCQLFWLTCIIVVAALFPSYLVDYLKLPMDQMGFILSSMGFGGAIGALFLPALSDRIGRKPVMLLSALLAFAAFWTFLEAGANTTVLFLSLMVAMGCLYALLTLTVGPITAESVPAKLMATGTGMVIGIGEIFGGGLAPALAGYIAKNFGIEHAVTMPLWALGASVAVIILLKETAPIRLRAAPAAALAQGGNHD